ncbi:pyridine nucleotide-disulfide oxidoreductase [Haloarcula hispanica N601]|uniref:Pyridine nucleotide-disulfide oxidoreductase n=3 Tax=Haloarcula hispanica TaxID=51589 RepID=V5TIV8_HALHI|nr:MULTISPECIES: NAD(P)/FAD-dependent oxidoreductase [Haloarcula]AEM56236.1 dihydrolipoamide dehydrogenase [Haloarcula hispanica ATCC 33960]AHB65048.1 pyridine nucleotide-disulfide oxidoreductase [Haloarcula hispanica N601]KAA9408969.1 NAD(P)/FAD-dependent oxidoreductase [Haloarcula hispanica]KZX47917.1 pyridine nucleotide-disulfide oxidoreductase [Haloarcula sp. K1]MUV51112.1 NAD(P)/FAD-dependent oxidoreductase [Haloarcula sp. CBA1122]
MTHVVIIGAYGSAGAAVAGDLVEEEDIELTLVDNGEPGGGLCILRGCMPSKEVLSAGAHRFQARHDERLVGDVPEVDLEAVVERKDDHVLDWAGHRRDSIHEMAERDDVTFIHDTATFVDEHTVRAGGEEHEADYVVIATGSSVNVPDTPGIDEVDFMTSDQVLDATEFPDSGIVMGFGYIGMEMVPYLAEAGGMELTVIEHDDRPIDEGDPEFGDAALDIYEDNWDVTIPTNCYEQELEETEDGGVRLTVEYDDGGEETFEADQLFLFTGRRPTVNGLGLENTSVSVEGDWAKDTMQTRDADHIYAVGDVNGKEPILHVAKEQGFTAAENIVRQEAGGSLKDYRNVHHHVIFSGLGVYPFARVGHNEETAKEAGYDVVTATRQASDDGVFKSKDVPEGLAKLVVDADDGTVLGWQGMHYHADSFAKAFQIIVELGLDVRDLPDRAYHPTLPENVDGLIRDCVDQL